MRAFLLLILLTLCGVAYADTVTLGPDDCGTLRACVSVPNDAAVDVSIYANPSYPAFAVFVDGVKYSAAAGNARDIVAAPATAPDGSVVLLTASWTTYRTCTHSGRGQYCLTHWQLTGGTISR